MCVGVWGVVVCGSGKIPTEFPRGSPAGAGEPPQRPRSRREHERPQRGHAGRSGGLALPAQGHGLLGVCGQTLLNPCLAAELNGGGSALATPAEWGQFHAKVGARAGAALPLPHVPLAAPRHDQRAARQLSSSSSSTAAS
jgi:hypothetical protein